MGTSQKENLKVSVEQCRRLESPSLLSRQLLPCQDSWVVLFSTSKLPGSEEVVGQVNRNGDWNTTILKITVPIFREGGEATG